MYESQFEDCLLFDQMFLHRETGFYRQHNCKVLNFKQIKIYHLQRCQKARV